MPYIISSMQRNRNLHFSYVPQIKYDKMQKVSIINSYFLSVIYIYTVHEIKFKLDLDALFYIKRGKRVETKGINALKPNKRIKHRTVN